MPTHPPLSGARALVAVTATVAVLLTVLSASATASDQDLATALHAWSKTIGADAHSVSLNARQRHPRLMAASAVRFSRDAVRARTAIAHERPSGANGRRAKGFAVRAFTSYALAGRRWAASGRARLRGQRRLATALAQSGAASARNGNHLLIEAGTFLP